MAASLKIYRGHSVDSWGSVNPISKNREEEEQKVHLPKGQLKYIVKN